jgi:hypothetical protein
MLPPVVQPPEDEPDEVALSALDEPGLDPEDAPVEVDDDGFLRSAGLSRYLPTDMDALVTWAGILVVVLAAFWTLGFLAQASLDAWASGVGDVPVPRPDVYGLLVLLAGVLLLVIRRGSAAATGQSGWTREAACLAVGTAGALGVVGLVGNIAAIIDPSGECFGCVANPVLPPTELAATVVGGLVGLTTVVVAVFAVVLGMRLYRWSPTSSEGEAEAGPEAAGVPIRRPVAALAIGMAVAAASLVLFGVGVARS